MEGRAFARGFNEVDWGTRFGHAMQMPGVDIGRPIRNAGNRDTGAASEVMTAINRTGLLTMATQAAEQRARQLRNIQIGRKVWNRAEQGDDPNEIAAAQLPTEIDTRTPEGKAMAAKIFPGGAGGREHVGPVNDRLADFETRETLTTGVASAAEKILTGKFGGSMTVPKMVFGAVRRARRGGR